MLYEAFYAQFPKGKFILTEREPDRWLKSVQKHFGDSVNPTRRFVYGQMGSIEAPEHYKKIYTTHNENVKAFFQEKGTDSFLVFKIEEGDGWETLCGFLDKAVPQTAVTHKPLPFPHANPASTRDFYRKHKRVRKFKRSLKRNIKHYFGQEMLRRVIKVKDYFLYRMRL